jgi:hypothetical protein
MRMTRQASSGELTGGRRPARVMMTPLTAFVLGHRRWIAGFWLLALVAGGAAAGKVPQRLSADFSLPGQPGSVAAQQIMRVYGNGGRAPSILTVTVPAGGNGPGRPGPDRRGFRQAPGHATPAPDRRLPGHRRSGVHHL